MKSIRAGGASIKEAHVFVRNGELFLLNANITPLKTASTHEKADPTRNRKLLLHKHEIMRLIGRVEQAGYSLILWTCTLKTAESNSNSASAKAKSCLKNEPISVSGSGNANKAVC